MSSHIRGSGTRSNAYSRSKLTNWTPFDPFEAEVSALPYRARPTEIAENGGQRVSVFERPLNERFARPFDAQDVCEVIEQLAPDLVAGLRAVILLGGTKKQDLVSYSGLFHWGCYCWDRIYLHPYPRRRLAYWLGTRVDPRYEREYGPSGVEILEQGGYYRLVWSEASLRRYYLDNVLLHEIGHHADKRAASRRKRERFADWFAAEQARVMRR